jgi:hypothetical protein
MGAIDYCRAWRGEESRIRQVSTDRLMRPRARRIVPAVNVAKKTRKTTEQGNEQRRLAVAGEVGVRRDHI